VEYIGHVTRTVCYPAQLGILRGEDERDKLVCVDPCHFVEDRQRRQDPERVAHLRGVGITSQTFEKG